MAPQSVVFDDAARYYDETRGFPPGLEAAAISAIARAGAFSPAMCVLEIGVGTGRIALPLASYVHGLVGVDLSAAMLARLWEKQQGQPLWPVRGDATRLPLRAASMDGAVAVHVFHLIPNWRDALQELVRVLRPSARLVSAYNDRSDAPSPVHDLLRQVWDDAVEQGRTRNVGVPRDAYATFLADSGWRQAGEPEVVAYSQARTPREHIDRMERRIWSSCWRLDDAALERGVAALRAALDREGIDPDTPYDIHSEFKAVAYLPPED